MAAPPMAESSLIARLFAEFLGTYVLVCVFGFNMLLGHPVWCFFAVGMAVTALTFGMGSVSGACFNPAVSLALGLCGKISAVEVLAYSSVQVTGALLGAETYTLVCDRSLQLEPTSGPALLQVGLVELVYTLVLVFVVLNLWTSTTGKDCLRAAAVGAVEICGGYAAGRISGGYFNPALAFAVEFSNKGLSVHWSIVYIGFQVVGSILACNIFRLCRKETRLADEERSLPSRLWSELIGTFVYVLTFGLVTLGRSPAAAVALAAAFACMAAAVGDISGGHFNPAVSLVVFLAGRRRFSLTLVRDLLAYIIVQCIGAIWAACLYTYLEDGRSLLLGPTAGFTWGTLAVSEVFFTGVLCYVMLCMAVEGHAPPGAFSQHPWKPLAAGACIAASFSAAARMSGGPFNPAAAVAMSILHPVDELPIALAYCGLQCVGAFLAALMFLGTHLVLYLPRDASAADQHDAAAPAFGEKLSQDGLHAPGRQHMGTLPVQRSSSMKILSETSEASCGQERHCDAGGLADPTSSRRPSADYQLLQKQVRAQQVAHHSQLLQQDYLEQQDDQTRKLMPLRQQETEQRRQQELSHEQPLQQQRLQQKSQLAFQSSLQDRRSLSPRQYHGRSPLRMTPATSRASSAGSVDSRLESSASRFRGSNASLFSWSPADPRDDEAH
eukprot:TRINITY_DN49033_c0_g1_i2.p1 TRINITY_DN49033_c0_g1~~TRINITY_DN49033_c0_g1_i2.p1  ORF type:complete len:667 (+),score=135.01 TRINITY_DN49033_c0_g1_i2:139-2139(+)